jgi:hypothetical protein
MWKGRSTKEKLDLIFVCVGILTFSLTAIIHIRTLRKTILAEKNKNNEQKTI